MKKYIGKDNNSVNTNFAVDHIWILTKKISNGSCECCKQSLTADYIRIVVQKLL